MRTRLSVVALLALALLIALPTVASAKNKKHENRGMLESMQSVPCGVKEHGLTGLGTVWASVGAHHVNSDEKLCAQYVFRTDEMDYHIRPADMKHAILLPVGHEGEFKIKKNRLYLKVPDGDKKTRAYQVISMEPHNASAETENTAYNPTHASTEYRRSEGVTNQGVTNQGVSNQGVSNQGVTNQGVTNQGVTNRQTANPPVGPPPQ